MGREDVVADVATVDAVGATDRRVETVALMTRAEGSSESLPFRSDIEGLRAIAILMVVLYHAHIGQISGGFFGVDVFFVLSGFLITGLLVQELQTSGRISLLNFWARRARRLLPAAAVVTLFVLIANTRILTPFDQVTYAGTARAFAVYASNFLFAIRNADYFAGATTHDPLLHTWSLSVEEQFYLAFAPILAIIGWSLRGRDASRINRAVSLTAIIASVLSFALCVWCARKYPTIGFYLLPTRIWEFGAGALLCIIVRGGVTENRTMLEGMSALGLTGLAVSALVLTDAQGLGAATLIPVLSTALLVYAGGGAQHGMFARLLSTAPLRFLGRLSYSWYLWHWPVLVYLRAQNPDASVMLQTLVAFGSLIPAYASYKLVESPIRFSRGLQRIPARVVVGAVGLSVAMVVLAVGANSFAQGVLKEPRYAAVSIADDLPAVHDNGCLVELLDVTVHQCQYGNASADTTVILFGDSHAAQWFPALDSIAALRHWKLRVLTKTACPLASVTVINGKLARRYTECETWRKVAIDSIVQLRPTLVIATAVRGYNMVLNERTVRSDSGDASRAEWGAGLHTTLNALTASGAHVFVLQDTPRLTFDAPNCVLKHIADENFCRVASSGAIDTAMASVERAQAQSVPNVSYMSLNDLMCDAEWCSANVNGIVRYRDTNHLSVKFSQSLAPALLERITAVLTAAAPARRVP